MNDYLFRSERLGFRQWHESDLVTFIDMNQDPQVMEFFPEPLKEEQSRVLFERFRAHYKEHGFCFYAVDRLDQSDYIGFIGFKRPGFEADFMPCIEIAWRIKRDCWNQGFATEGALRCLDYGFEQLGFDEVHSFTSAINLKSEHIMKKIGMKKVDEFEHPLLKDGSPLKRHVLYKIKSTPRD